MKIGQFSKISGLTTYTIRYYEKIGLLQQPDKNSSGHRVYDETDLALINWVTCLKKSGMALQKIKQYAHAYRNDENSKLVELLELHLTKLRTQQLDINHYIDVTSAKLIQLAQPTQLKKP